MRNIAAAVIIAAAIAIGGTCAAEAAAAPPAAPAAHHLPGWFHWAGTSDRSHGKPCIIAWGGNGQHKARVCEDGSASVR